MKFLSDAVHWLHVALFCDLLQMHHSYCSYDDPKNQRATVKCVHCGHRSEINGPHIKRYHRHGYLVSEHFLGLERKYNRHGAVVSEKRIHEIPWLTEEQRKFPVE